MAAQGVKIDGKSDDNPCVVAEKAPVKTYYLAIHDDAFSPEDVLCNVYHVGQVAGSLLQIRSAESEPSSPEVARIRGAPKPIAKGSPSAPLLFIARDVPKDIKARGPDLQLSVSSRIADEFNLKRNQEVQVVEVSRDDHTVSHVELAFKDIYLTRAEMRRIVATCLKDRVLHVGHTSTYLTSIKVCIKSIYKDGHRVRCAYFSNQSKPIFRTESTRFIIYIQMSKEMWNFHPDGSGEVMFEKITNRVLPELIRRWNSINARHLVSVVFFTRIGNVGLEAVTAHPDNDSSKHQDIFKVVMAELSSGEWNDIARQLKAEFQHFLPDALQSMRSERSSPVPANDERELKDENISAGEPTAAMHGNFLEAINTASSPFSQDFIDADLVRTGLSILIITPSPGIFEVDEKMLRLTTENLVNNGINIDLLCLTPPPLHVAPILRYRPSLADGSDGNLATGAHVTGDLQVPIYAITPPSMALSVTPPHLFGSLSTPGNNTRRDQMVYVVPQWLHWHFWGTVPAMTGRIVRVLTNSLTTHKDRLCSLGDVQMNGLMESETACIALPPLQIKAMDLGQATIGAQGRDGTETTLDGPRTSHDKDTASQKARLELARGIDQYNAMIFSLPRPASALDLKTPHRRSNIELPAPDGGSLRLGGGHGSNPATIDNTPVPKPGFSLLYKQFKGELPASTHATDTEQATPVTKRPQAPPRLASTASSIRTSTIKRRLMFSSNRGLSIGKASASTAQVTTQAEPLTVQRTALNSKSDVTYERPNKQERPTPSSTRASSQSSMSRVSVAPSAPSITFSTKAQDIPRPGSRSTALRSPEPDSGMSSPENEPQKQQVPATESRRPSQSPVAVKRNPLSEMPFSLARWLIVANPAKPEDLRSVDQGWSHAFVRPSQATSLDMKWKSLCFPASLPLTSDYVIRRNMLPYYEERTHRITLDDDEQYQSLQQARVQTLSQLIAFRLAKGFQVVKGFADDDFSPFDDTMLEDEGRVVFMMKGNTVHALLSTGGDIQVNMYQPKKSSVSWDVEEDHYTPLIKSTLEPTYEVVKVPLSLARDEHNWSTIDNFIAGHLENFTSATGFWRARFVLIPVEPSRQVKRSEDTLDELRIEGILRLSQIWHRSKVIDSDTESVHNAQYKNPLGIEFQTRDLSAVLSAGLEDSRLLRGENLVRSTQLFDQDEGYHSDNIDLKQIAGDLQGQQGIKVKDRRWYLKLHRQAFVGLDLTTWLAKNVTDLETREAAEQLGRKLMEQGLFKHVRGAHTFRDGNYFYEFAPDYKVSKNTGVAKTASPRIAAKEKNDRNVSSSSDTKGRASTDTATDVTQAKAPVEKPRVDLTAKLRCDIDPRRKSDRAEVVSLHYDRLCNPEASYHLRLEWMNATEKLVEEAISSWVTTADRYGWKLVQAPLAEACKIADVNPFRTPTVVTFAVPPPTQAPDLSHVDSTAPEVLPSHRYHPYRRALLKRFGFVMDVEAAVNMPSDVDVRYSYPHINYQYSQYIHKTGTIMAQIDVDGRLLLVANRLANNRSSFARDAAARMEKREHDRIASGGNMSSYPGTNDISTHPSTTNMDHSRLPMSPRTLPRDAERPQAQTAAPTRPQERERDPQTAEQVKESLQAFCADAAALYKFYEEVSQRDPLLSPKPTPAMRPREAPSTRGTPLLQATIPTLELPPLSGIGMLLSGSGSSSSTPASEVS